MVAKTFDYYSLLLSAAYYHYRISILTNAKMTKAQREFYIKSILLKTQEN